jgi:hypothetical protein
VASVAPNAANFGASLCSGNFQYPNFGTGPSRGPLRFRGDRFDPWDRASDAGATTRPADASRIRFHHSRHFQRSLNLPCRDGSNYQLVAQRRALRNRDPLSWINERRRDNRPLASPTAMGAIAAKGDQNAIQLFRKVILASVSVPGILRPVPISVAQGGRSWGTGRPG